MPWGVFRDLQGWSRFAPTFLGVKLDEISNTKGKHVVARGDAVLDRSSTLLTSTKKPRSQDRGFSVFSSEHFAVLGHFLPSALPFWKRLIWITLSFCLASGFR